VCQTDQLNISYYQEMGYHHPDEYLAGWMNTTLDATWQGNDTDLTPDTIAIKSYVYNYATTNVKGYNGYPNQFKDIATKVQPLFPYGNCYQLVFDVNKIPNVLSITSQKKVRISLMDPYLANSVFLLEQANAAVDVGTNKLDSDGYDYSLYHATPVVYNKVTEKECDLFVTFSF
jgi:hypothetical protein